MTLALLRDFLVCGVVGELRHGITADNVRALFGDPEDRSTSRFADIWKYGSLQIAFSVERASRLAIVDFMGLYRNEAMKLPPALCLGGWWPDKRTTRVQFEEHLRNLQVPFIVAPELTFESQICLSVGVGVSVLFRIEAERQTIDSMQYASRMKGPSEP